MFNQQKHEKGKYSGIDEYSSLLLMEIDGKIIRKFARENKMTLVVVKGDPWKIDSERSYILKKAFEALY